MTLDRFAIHLKDLPPADQESAWLSAAVQAIGAHHLLTTPIGTPVDGEPDIYRTIEALAEQFDRPSILTAKQALKQHDAVFLEGPRSVEIKAPSDSACDFYTPQLEAAYFLGIAMGMRAAAALAGQKRKGEAEK